uniref:MAX gene-associated protein n=1 Tax=Lygus hesperus TaxID=30085 RepID=A0A0A9W6A4_LYGHE
MLLRSLFRLPPYFLPPLHSSLCPHCVPHFLLHPRCLCSVARMRRGLSQICCTVSSSGTCATRCCPGTSNSALYAKIYTRLLGCMCCTPICGCMVVASSASSRISLSSRSLLLTCGTRTVVTSAAVMSNSLMSGTPSTSAMLLRSSTIYLVTRYLANSYVSVSYSLYSAALSVDAVLSCFLFHSLLLYSTVSPLLYSYSLPCSCRLVCFFPHLLLCYRRLLPLLPYFSPSPYPLWNSVVCYSTVFLCYLSYGHHWRVFDSHRCVHPCQLYLLCSYFPCIYRSILAWWLFAVSVSLVVAVVSTTTAAATAAAVASVAVAAVTVAAVTVTAATVAATAAVIAVAAAAAAVVVTATTLVTVVSDLPRILFPYSYVGTVYPIVCLAYDPTPYHRYRSTFAPPSHHPTRYSGWTHPRCCNRCSVTPLLHSLLLLLLRLLSTKLVCVSPMVASTPTMRVLYSSLVVTATVVWITYLTGSIVARL